MKKVSVIIPVYNMADKIEKSVESILKQNYKNIEVILVDDGSKDESFRKCELLSNEHENIKVFHTENQGSGPARNYGIRMATGDYAYFPDADDLLEPNAIEILVDTMLRFKCDLIVFGFRNMNVQGKLISEKKYQQKIYMGDYIRRNYHKFFNMDDEFGIQGAPWNKFFDLHKIKKKKIEYPALKRHQDEVFISRYVNYVDKVCFIENVLYTYNTNDLKKEWDKFPVDYLDIVIKLKNYREDIIVKWNQQNEIVLDMIEREYICKVIKALELSFSKKFNFKQRDRKKWFSVIIQKSGLTETSIPKRFNMKYQEFVMSLVYQGKLNVLYFLIFTKVFVERYFHKGIIITKKIV
ncbi:MAG: glycosyltransferase family 2 protein [Ectobacillus sp.]